MVTATLHKITAGDGYQYYTRQTAAQDVSSRGSSGLSDYYSNKGESPGRWFGSGLSDLDVTYRGTVIADSQISAGSVVTEAQMAALFGLGQHPNAEAIQQHVIDVEIAAGAKGRDATRAAKRASQLGAPFRIYDSDSEYRQRCGEEFAAHNTLLGRTANAPIEDDERATIRTTVARTMFQERFARPPLDERELSGWVARLSRQHTTAVAGWDWTFSPVKSVSALWALAPPEVAEKILQAHHAAVKMAIEYIENNATFTRLGRNGVRQVEVGGLVCAVFDHRDSRSGDPDLHTHVGVSGKVRTADGLWRAIDGTMFYRVCVSASEVYNTGLEMEMLTRLSDAERRQYGVEFAERPGADPAKRPIREIVGMATDLLESWSQREAELIAYLGELTIAFQRQHGRAPRPDEMYRLNQQATLDTRPAKKLQRSLAEQRAAWREQAIRVLGSEAALEGMLAAALQQRAAPRPGVDAKWIAARADELIATISAERSSWRYSHVRAEAERIVRGRIAPGDWMGVSAALVAQALGPGRSIARGDPDITAEPGLRVVPRIFQRGDGTSVYTTVASQTYTSAKSLAIEAKLIELTRESGGRTLPDAVVNTAIRAFTASGKQLNEDQTDLIARFAFSGRRIDVANAPAGTGKTTAMRVLAEAWRADGGTVLGLAPTAAAAQELGEAISAVTDTLDKLLSVLDAHTPTPERVASGRYSTGPLPQWVLDISHRTVVIIDEHARITDDKRLRALMYLLSRDATVRFLGDLAQLPAIGAGGTAQDIVEEADAITLSQVVRFADSAEGPASVLIREGDPAGFGFYVDRGRVHVGSPASISDDAYTAWSADIATDHDAVLLAPTHAIVHELNQRARADRVARAAGPVGAETLLADKLSASAGDTIRTTSNNRRLRMGEVDFVRNGYRWKVQLVHPDGSLTAVRVESGRTTTDTVILPAHYVAQHVRLGYAATIDSAQGITCDTCHVALAGNETRHQLYVALTRGRHANHAYLTTTIDGSEGSFYNESAAFPRTGVEFLLAILARTDTRTSAHTELRRALDPLERMGRAVDIYLDALGMAIEHTLGPTELAHIETAAEQLHPGLTGYPAWPVLRQHMATIALDGRDPALELADAIASRELGTAKDVAAVLDWRLDSSGSHSAPPGPLPWVPGIPDAVRKDADVTGFLDARVRIITDLTHQIRLVADAFTAFSAPVWARSLIGADPGLLADLAIWRAANHIETTDTRPTGPVRYMVVERKHQQLLDARVTEAIGDIHLPATRWAALAKSIEPRVIDDPFWPTLADRLETADRVGIDVATMLTTAAAVRPLPDELAAAALWSRLDLEPSALSTRASTLRPHWLPDMIAVLGARLAERVIADPAWPKVVAAIDSAAGTAWTPHELLETAGELLATGSGETSVRPDQLATALAWCIAAVLLDAPTHEAPHPDQPPAEPPFPDPDEADIVPDPSFPQDPVMTDPEFTAPSPDTTSTTAGEQPASDTSPPPLSREIREIAALMRVGATGTVPMELRRVLGAATDLERRTVARVVKTLETYPFGTATARLHAAARDNPDLRKLIHACIPDQDPGVYRPPEPPAPPDPELNARGLRWPRPAADESERRTMRRILKTLETYPFRLARTKLLTAADRIPEHRQLILNSLPPTDPGLYRPQRGSSPTTNYRRTEPQHVDRRIDPARRIPREHQRGQAWVVADYLADQGDSHIMQPSPDDRTRNDQYTPRPAPDEPHGAEGNPENIDTAARDPRSPQKSEVRVSGAKPAYGSGESELDGLDQRGLACVHCMLERPLRDTGRWHTPAPRTVDDGLCTDCRQDGRPGIPDHNPRDHLRARCEFIAASRPPEQARTLLLADYRNARTLAVRLAIASWVEQNLPAPPPAPAAPETPIEDPDRLRTMTDTELTERHSDLQQHIQLNHSTTAILDNPTLHTPNAPTSATAQDFAAAQNAITEALQAKNTHAATAALVQQARSTLTDLHTQLDNTPTHAHAQRRELERDLKSQTRQHKQLQADLEHARTTWRATRRNAILHAGPEDQWERILHRRPDETPTPDTTTITAAEQHATHERTRLQHELRATQAELDRRTALSPAQREDEQRHRQLTPSPDPDLPTTQPDAPSPEGEIPDTGP